jgi:hypothetical protein
MEAKNQNEVSQYDQPARLVMTAITSQVQMPTTIMRSASELIFLYLPPQETRTEQTVLDPSSLL